MKTQPTLIEVINALEVKKINYELTGETTKIIWNLDKPLPVETFYGLDFGISLSPGLWAWFRVSMDYDTCDTISGFWFRQRYNANIGHMMKSYKVENKCFDAIEKLIGINLRPY